MAGDVAGSNTAHSDTSDSRRRSLQHAWLAGLLLLAVGLAWTLYAWQDRNQALPQQPLIAADSLSPGTVAAMDSPAIVYGEGWQFTDEGADPNEPADPWVQPSGILTFTYMGDEVALSLAVGDYWAYLYVTVDGQPANLLPYIRGNRDSRGLPAGYRTFLEPEKSADGIPVARWVRVHRDRGSAEHEVRIEVWRGWGQSPLRGIAIDALPAPPTPVWPGVAAMVLGAALPMPAAVAATRRTVETEFARGWRRRLSWLLLPGIPDRTRLIAAGAFLFVAAGGIVLSWWLLTVVGLAALVLLSLSRPALWTAATVFSLPFYFSFTVPVLPNRALGLIDTFVLAGAIIAAANWFLDPPDLARSPRGKGRLRTLGLLLAYLIGWALVSLTAAAHMDVALYEWRTVFLSAGLFGFLLVISVRSPRSGRADLWLIVSAWLAGGTIVALIGLVQYASGTMVVTAEGVQRIRAFYGSPNNLALYLERTFVVTVALAAFLPAGRARVAWAIAAIVQGIALVLTFSKGSLFLGIPAGLFVLWLGGLILLPAQGRSRRPLLWLSAAILGIVAVLLPFLDTERFRGLLDFSQGTGYLRLQLWRSSWQMALDHPLMGVGPDNFLYAYRSTYLLPEAWQEPNLNHPHNWILDWWTRIGLPGLIGAVALFAIGFRELWRAASSTEIARLSEAVLSLGFLAAGVTALAHGLIDASFALPDLMIVWVLILVAMVALPEHEAASPGKNRPA